VNGFRLVSLDKAGHPDYCNMSRSLLAKDYCTLMKRFVQDIPESSYNWL
jgi:hypothetical protein